MLLPIEFKSFNVVIPASIRIDLFILRELVDFADTRSCLLRSLLEEPNCIKITKTIFQIILLCSVQLLG
jgi:hypothetical protein